MNLLLLHDDDFEPDGTVRLTGRRLRHAREVLRAAAGDLLRVGRLGGRVGAGEVLTLSDEEVRLRVTLDAEPPPRANVDLLLAMPRPKALKRILPAIASLGVDRLVLVNAARVEKSYFASDVLDREAAQRLLELGLEQARDTVAPEVLVRPRFRPFVEDELPALFSAARHLWLAHPGTAQDLRALPRPEREDGVVLAIGPEGGWVPFEIDLLEAKGFTAFSIGPRVLRTETVVPLLVGQVALLRA